MAGQSTISLYAFGGIAAYASGGPLAQTFDEMALAFAIWGMLGGFAMSWHRARPWSAVTRATVVGGILAAAAGAVSPAIIKSVSGVDIAPDGEGLRVLMSGAFFLGVVQDLVFHWAGKAKAGSGTDEQ